ncbi:MAG: hypothetical protein JWO68_3098 [Actinomycetia bacterium]|nr:hypothetical protein [Actinomycetes bacterium]
MLGAIILGAILLVGFPVGFLMTMTGVAAALGTALKQDGEARHEGSELVELNV